MKNFSIFLDPTGTWRGNLFPEYPKSVVRGENSNKFKEYEAAVEKLKSEALEVSNPNIFFTVSDDNEMMIETGRDEKNTFYKAVEPGVLYPWDGGWEIDFKNKKGFLRLLPKSPVTPDTKHCGGINCPFERSCVDGCMYPITDYVLERPSEDGEGVIGTVRGAAVPQAGIVATGVPEFNVRDNAIVVSGTVSGKSSSEILNEFSALRGATGREEPEQKFVDDTDEIQMDLHIYGVAYEMLDDNGSIHRLDPTKIRIRRLVEPSPQADSQEDMWIEAIELYNKREHTADGRADIMKEFTITKIV